jgi:hypothetical protein
MIPTGLFTQILMIIVSVAIILTYVKPTFLELSKTQDDIAVYREEQEKVIAVNSRLADLTAKISSIPVSDQRKLLTYLPDTLDEVMVARDLLFITVESGASYESVEYANDNAKKGRSNTSNSDSGNENLPTKHTFELSVIGTYEQVKRLFELIEQNNYPLEVHGAELTGSGTDFITASLTLVTYTYKGEEKLII